MKPYISEAGFNEIGQAIEALGEVLKKHNVPEVQVTINTITNEAECAIVEQPEGETN